MFLCCKLSYYLVQSPCYDQVLTGILPYGNNNRFRMAYNITYGKRPSRPTDPSQNKWLQDPVWDAIMTCWSDTPKQRYELSIVYHVFSGDGQLEAGNVRLGELNTHHNRDLTTAGIEAGPQQRRRFFPQITSLFQFLRESEPEIEKSVGEMDKAGFFAFPPLPIPRLT
jgi:hypothetical protein